MFLAPQVPLSVSLHTYSNGLRGVAQTIGVMRSLVASGKIDPVIRQAAMSIVYLTPEKDSYSEALALFEHVQTRIRYVGDVYGIETIATASKTLLGKGGDCDDKSILLASLMEAIGYPTRFVAAGYSAPGHLEHVYVQVCLDGDWIDCDTTEPYPMGWAGPDAVCFYVERIQS